MYKFTNQELFQFCEQFSILLRSGMSLSDCLLLLADDETSPELKDFLCTLSHSTEETNSLSLSLSQTNMFPQYMIAYVRAGEETGCLDEVMENLALHYEYEMEISQQIRNAVIYPCIMSGMVFAVVVLLLCKVLPVFQQVFHQLGMELSEFSLGLLKAGQLLYNYRNLLITFALFICIIICILFIHPTGKKSIKNMVLKLPMIKRLCLYTDYAHLSQGISMGLKSGLSPDESLTLTMELVSLPEIRARLQTAQMLMQNGTRFSKALIESEVFAGTEARLILISVETGSLDEIFHRLSLRYSERSMDAISHVISIIEPTIVILLSLLVGIILLSVMTPLLGILSQLMI